MFQCFEYILWPEGWKGWRGHSMKSPFNSFSFIDYYYEQRDRYLMLAFCSIHLNHPMTRI